MLRSQWRSNTFTGPKNGLATLTSPGVHGGRNCSNCSWVFATTFRENSLSDGASIELRCGNFDIILDDFSRLSSSLPPHHTGRQ